MYESGWARRRVLLVGLPFAVAVLLRVYPYLVYGVPYSTDSWSPIRNTQELLANTPTSLGGNAAFDSYNIYWPANSLFGAVASLVFGQAPIRTMPLLFPVVGAITVLVFFLVAEEVSGSAIVASIAALFLATAGVDAIFTAAVTKETYALPLFMLAVLLLLWKTDLKSGTLFAMTSVTLAMSQHAASLLLLLVASSVVLVKAVLSARRGEPMGKGPLLVLTGGAITAAYLLGYAQAGLGQLASLVSVQSLLLAGAFLTMFVAPVAYHVISKPTRLLLAEGGAVLGVAVGLLLAGTRLAVIPSAPAVSSALLFAAIPYVLGGALTVVGYWVVQTSRDRREFGFLASWLATVLALGFLAVFSDVPDGLAIVYRALAFIAAPAIVLAAIALHRMLHAGGGRLAVKVLVALVVLAICLPSAYQTYAASIQRENLLGGQWVYQQSDLSGAKWISSNAGDQNLTVAGDLRMEYLLTDYLGVPVDTEAGHQYLESPATAPRPEYLVTYGTMAKNGYVVSLYGVPLPKNWTASLERSSPLLYSNGNIILW